MLNILVVDTAPYNNVLNKQNYAPKYNLENF